MKDTEVTDDETNKLERDLADLTLLRTVIEQNWYHYRHVETNRIYFTSVYSALTAAVFLVASNLSTDKITWITLPSSIPLLSILFSLSSMGLGIALVANDVVQKHTQALIDIFEKFPAAVAFRDYIGLPREKPRPLLVKLQRTFTRPRTRYLYVALYGAATSVYLVWIVVLGLRFLKLI